MKRLGYECDKCKRTVGSGITTIAPIGGPSLCLECIDAFAASAARARAGRCAAEASPR